MEAVEPPGKGHLVHRDGSRPKAIWHGICSCRPSVFSHWTHNNTSDLLHRELSTRRKHSNGTKSTQTLLAIQIKQISISTEFFNSWKAWRVWRGSTKKTKMEQQVNGTRTSLWKVLNTNRPGTVNVCNAADYRWSLGRRNKKPHMAEMPWADPDVFPALFPHVYCLSQRHKNSSHFCL